MADPTYTFAKREWNVKMLAETVLSMLTYICDFKHSRHQVWQNGLQPYKKGFVQLSIAEFSL